MTIEGTAVHANTYLNLIMCTVIHYPENKPLNVDDIIENISLIDKKREQSRIKMNYISSLTVFNDL